MLIALHIVLGIGTTIASILLFLNKTSGSAKMATITGLFGSISSGIALVALTNVSLLHACAAGLVLTIVSLCSLYMAKNATVPN